MIEERRLDSLIRKPIRNATGEKDPNRRPPSAKKSTPPDQTNAEQFYYSKQMQGKTHMVVVLTDGEQLEGVIEWYDRDCLKLNRTGAPNLLLFKHCIKYMYKAEE
ncbi:MAG TPA: RNA chaperone Hfq [Bryobacteraceae bacterium]|jgi:sRNA-binding regulator protein Hfq|nr:RNA chaperone Hfq [Bryobacteraceae bacterium]